MAKEFGSAGKQLPSGESKPTEYMFQRHNNKGSESYITAELGIAPPLGLSFLERLDFQKMVYALADKAFSFLIEEIDRRIKGTAFNPENRLQVIAPEQQVDQNGGENPIHNNEVQPTLTDRNGSIRVIQYEYPTDRDSNLDNPVIKSRIYKELIH